MNPCLDEISTYQTVSFAGLGLTFLNIIAIRIALPLMMGRRRITRGIPSQLFLNRAALFLVFSGLTKICIGVILLTVLYPSDCEGVFLYYPYLVLVLGFLWLLRSYGFHKLAVELSRNPAAQPAIAYAYATPVAIVGSVPSVDGPKAPYNSMA